MVYYLEIKTEHGIIEHTFNNKNEAIQFIHNLTNDEIDNIVTVYKYNNGSCFQAWDDITL